MSTFFNCKEVSAKIDADTAEKLQKLAAAGVQARLALFQIGDKADESTYAAAIIRKCELLGVETELHRFPEDVGSAEYLAAFRQANDNDDVDGLLLLQPLPRHIESEIIKREIPTSFTRGTAEVVRQIELCQPDLVLNVGQAGGAAGLRVERVAINLADARIPDNDGAQPVDEPLVQDSAPAYFAKLPVKAMVRGVQAKGYPCQLSYTAGTYVCNAVMYTVLHTVQSDPHIRAGFVHVPYAASQLEGKAAGTPAMPLADITAALAAAIEAAVQNKTDLKEQMGRLD